MQDVYHWGLTFVSLNFFPPVTVLYYFVVRGVCFHSSPVPSLDFVLLLLVVSSFGS